MSTEFVTVFQQVIILFVLIFIGYVCAKKKVFTEEGIKNITKFVLFFVTPCVIISSFDREYDPQKLYNLGMVTAIAVAIHIFNIVCARLFIREKEENKLRVYRYGAIFSNCGYMALPLQSALLGSDGVFYGAAFIAVFNLFTWTYGSFEMGGTISPKKIIFNPGIIGICIGLVLFLTPLQLPTVIGTSVASLAALNTPLPMVIIGFYLSKITSLKIIGNIQFLWSVALRIVILPVSVLLILVALHVTGIVLDVVMIACATPTAANTTMFASLFNRDGKIAAAMVSVSTVFAIISMPLIISWAISLH